MQLHGSQEQRTGNDPKRKGGLDIQSRIMSPETRLLQLGLTNWVLSAVNSSMHSPVGTGTVLISQSFPKVSLDLTSKR